MNYQEKNRVNSNLGREGEKEFKEKKYSLVVKALYIVLEHSDQETKNNVITTIMSASQEALLK